MTGEDLKRLQDHFLEGGQKILVERGRLHPVGFVVTLSKHVDKLFEDGSTWAAELLDPKACMRDPHDDKIATLVIDLLMDWKKIYHAVLNVFPATRDVLRPMISLAESLAVDDPHKRVMRPFLAQTQMDTKDIIAATMRHVCGKVDAFASIFQSEAWIRVVDLDKEREADVPPSLANDAKAVETVFSSMETYNFLRMLTVPIVRSNAATKKRDDGKVVGFGERAESVDSPADSNRAEGRLVRFLKPLEIAS